MNGEKPKRKRKNEIAAGPILKWLDENEHILWIGQPDSSQFWLPNMGQLMGIPAGLLLGSISVCAIADIAFIKKSPLVVLWSAPFLLVAAVVAIAPIWSGLNKHLSTIYAVTEKRAISYQDQEQCYMRDWDHLDAVRRTDNHIIFVEFEIWDTSKPRPYMLPSSTEMWFRNVDNVDEVFELVKKLHSEAMDRVKEQQRRNFLDRMAVKIKIERL